MFLKKNNDTKINNDELKQNAADRALLYLRCLNYPPTQSYHLVLEALQIAESTKNSNLHNNTVYYTLNTLQQIIHKSHLAQLSINKEFDYSQSIEDNENGSNKKDVYCTDRTSKKIQSTPPVRRLHMKPVQLKPQKWGTVLVSWFTNAIVM